MRTKTSLWPLYVALSLHLGGCRAEVGASMIEIQHAVAPDLTCLYNPGNPMAAAGFYDPRAKPTGYDLVLLLRNNLQARADNPALMDQSVNVKNRTNNLALVGFEGCWYQNSGQVTTYGTYTESGIVDCKTLPLQSGSLPSAGTMDEGGQGATLAYVQVLTPEHLKQIFGADFSALSIPEEGLQSGTDLNGRNLRTYSHQPQSPANAPRAAAWGDKFPDHNPASVVVQLRAVMAAQSGEVVRSGWYNYPIEVCVGCVTASCGPLVEKSCSLPLCSDGSACVNNVCTIAGVTSPCPRQSTLSGSEPAYVGTGICDPAQGFSAADCTLKTVGC